jgi:protein phosphatase
VVSFDTIGATLREYPDPNQCAERLVQLALRGGGPDNITVIVADVTDQDIVESVPIVGGAAARDRGMATSADQSMSSARGAALSSPRPATPAPPEPADDGHDAQPRARRHPVRNLLVLVVLLGALGGLLWYGWRYTQSQYYVGATNDGAVVIFRGVPGKVAWLNLSSVHERSDLRLSDLTPVAQNNVKRGIPADNESEARRTLDELRDPNNPANRQQDSTCQSSPGPAPSGSPGSPGSPGVAASAPSGSAAPGAASSVGVTSGSGAPGSPVSPAPSAGGSAQPDASATTSSSATPC